MPRPVSSPRIASRLDTLDLALGGLHDELVLEAVLAGGHAGESVSARNVEIMASHLQDAEISGARLAQLALSDCRVTRGSLANTTVRGGTVQRTALEGVRLTGLAFHEGTVRDVTFARCRIDLASFAASRLERVVFEDCSLAESDLQDARLSSVTFEGCDLTRIDFSGARFGGHCVMRDCRLEGARAVERLRGVAMPVTDVLAAAETFAAAMGVRILEPEEDEA